MITGRDLWSDLWDAATATERYTLLLVASRSYGIETVMANVTGADLLSAEPMRSAEPTAADRADLDAALATLADDSTPTFDTYAGGGF